MVYSTNTYNTDKDKMMMSLGDVTLFDTSIKYK